MVGFHVVYGVEEVKIGKQPSTRFPKGNLTAKDTRNLKTSDCGFPRLQAGGDQYEEIVSELSFIIRM